MWDATDIDVDLLPDSAYEIADIVGLGATLQLVEAYGGTRLYFPSQYDPDHHVCKLVGVAYAVKLIDVYGGSELEVPRCTAALRAVIHRQICKAYGKGATARELARRYQCTERWIFIVLARRRQALASQQAQLF